LFTKSDEYPRPKKLLLLQGKGRKVPLFPRGESQKKGERKMSVRWGGEHPDSWGKGGEEILGSKMASTRGARSLFHGKGVLQHLPLRGVKRGGGGGENKKKKPESLSREKGGKKHRTLICEKQRIGERVLSQGGKIGIPKGEKEKGRGRLRSELLGKRTLQTPIRRRKTPISLNTFKEEGKRERKKPLLIQEGGAGGSLLKNTEGGKVRGP